MTQSQPTMSHGLAVPRSIRVAKVSHPLRNGCETTKDTPDSFTRLLFVDNILGGQAQFLRSDFDELNHIDTLWDRLMPFLQDRFAATLDEYLGRSDRELYITLRKCE